MSVASFFSTDHHGAKTTARWPSVDWASLRRAVPSVKSANANKVQRLKADQTIDKHDAVGKTVQSDKVTLTALREAIPPHCFKPSWSKSLYYMGRDVSMLLTFGYLAYNFIPLIPSAPLRGLAWAFYGFMQGLVFTGLWVIAHELGHGSQLPSQLANNIFGFIIHTCEGTPYYSFKSTHAKHHRYTAHMERDLDHVPLRYESDRDETHERTNTFPLIARIEELIEDAPFYALFRLVCQQLLGWPLYLTFSISSGPSSAEYKRNKLTAMMPEWMRKSQINPLGSLFRNDEILAILGSDLGIVAFTALLWKAAQVYGFGTVFLMYGQPYLWLNHWIVAVTFLHHTHPDVPKFETEAWTFIKGATATVDREFPIIGRFFLHNIACDHVVHHIFPRMAFYHAPEATAAMKPILGDMYHHERKNYIACLYREFTTCNWVMSDDKKDPKERAMWFVDASSNVPSSASLEKSGKKKKIASWI